jgi:hypothetical protein
VLYSAVVYLPQLGHILTSFGGEDRGVGNGGGGGMVNGGGGLTDGFFFENHLLAIALRHQSLIDWLMEMAVVDENLKLVRPESVRLATAQPPRRSRRSTG